MPGIFIFWQLRKSPRRQERHVPSWPPCQPTPTRCPFFHSETPSPTSSMTPATMPRNSWIVNPRPRAFFREHVAVAVAHPTGLHLDPHMSCTRLRVEDVDDVV